MESMVYREVNKTAEIMRKLEASRKHLKLNNLFSCIVGFQEVLETFIEATSRMIEPERIKVATALNEFQQNLTTSHQFQDIYGSVNFRDNDFRTSFEFIGQLIKIKEDEIASILIGKEFGELLNLGNLTEEEQQKTLKMVSLAERGEQMALRQLVSENDELASLVLTYYNDNGINFRAAGDVKKAIQEYKKAVLVSPDDEHLLYNLARAYIETGNKKSADETIRLAISVNPEFQEGLKLQRYINQWTL